MQIGQFLFVCTCLMPVCNNELNKRYGISLTYGKVMALKTPICSFDAKTGVLCSKCEERLRSKDLTEDEVHASIVLTRLAQRYSEVDKITLVTAFKVEADFVLVMRGSDLQLIRTHEAIRAETARQFGARVWMVESDSSDRRFIENLLYPRRVLSVNLIWLPDGNKLTRAILDSNRTSDLENDLYKIQRIAKKIKDIELLVEHKK
jgi:transcription antitermination factor NusA-like protein